MRKSVQAKEKERKDKKEFINNAIVIKRLISLYAELSVKCLLMFKLKEITKEIENFDFDMINYLATYIPKKIVDNEDIMMKLASSFSINDGIQFDEEEFNSFNVLMNEFLTIDLIKDTLNGYDKKGFLNDKVLEGARIVTSVDLGEEYEVV